MLLQAIENDPLFYSAYQNLGNALQEKGAYDKAITAYQKALELQKNPGLLNNLANAFFSLGKVEEAIQHYRKALEIDEDYVPAFSHLGHALSRVQQFEPAIDACKRAVELQPTTQMHYRLATVYLDSGEKELAKQSLKKALLLEQDHSPSRHLLDALVGKKSVAAPKGYIVDLYNGFADTFDDLLVQHLQYCMPEKMAEQLACFRKAKPQHDILDLGCGTALSGKALAPWAKKLDGIDLSENMLQKAKERGIYDNLWQKDIVSACCMGKYDIIAACDVLIYTGDLAPVFQSAFTALKTGGMLIFSVEVGESSWQLLENGRFAHSIEYCKNELKKKGFTLIKTDFLVARKERGKGVESALFITEK